MTDEIEAVLIAEKHSGGNQYIPILWPQITFGREETNTIVNNDYSTSRNHAVLWQEDGKFLIKDTGSTNGTYVNDKKLTGPHELQEGDRIGVGFAVYRFSRPDKIDDIANEMLAQVPLFDNLNIETWRSLVTGSRYEHIQKGHLLAVDYFEDKLVVVLMGELAVRREQKAGGSPADGRQYTSGQFFDADHLLNNCRFTQIECLQKSWLLLINREQMDTLIYPFLEELAFLVGLTVEQRQAIAEMMNLDCYRDKSIIFKQGDPADALYIVIYGSVGVLKLAEKDEHTIEDEIRTYKRGDLFGELGLLIDQERAATGLVKEDTGVMLLSKARFQELVARYPNIVLFLYQYLASLLEEQSIAFWHAAQDIEKMKNLIQQTKMAALGQLVAGVAHEINTPVGSINANSKLLKEIIMETRERFEEWPQLVADFYETERLQQTAVSLNLTLDETTLKLVQALAAEQQKTVQAHYKEMAMEMNFLDLEAIADELGEAAGRITQIVKNLANFTRLDQAERKAVNIHDGLDATLSLLHHELKYQVIVTKEYGRLPEVTCYPDQLNQVFMNIIMNGIQALELEKLGRDEKGHLTIRTYQDGKWAVVAIQDSGKGMSEAEMKKIFDPYFSTKGAAAAADGLGLGLGLSISQKIIVEKHQGSIEVESAVGEGSTFYIKLPLDNYVSTSKATTDTRLKTLWIRGKNVKGDETQ